MITTGTTPETLSSMAMAGASTETEIAMASGSRSAPWASSPLPVLVSRSGLVLAIVRPPSFSHQAGLLVQVVVECQRRAFALVQPRQEGELDRMGTVGVHRVQVGKLGVQKVGIAAGTCLGQVGAEAAPGHQPHLAGPGRH